VLGDYTTASGTGSNATERSTAIADVVTPRATVLQRVLLSTTSYLLGSQLTCASATSCSVVLGAYPSSGNQEWLVSFLSGSHWTEPAVVQAGGQPVQALTSVVTTGVGTFLALGTSGETGPSSVAVLST
jgi:hypothetical protein